MQLTKQYIYNYSNIDYIYIGWHGMILSKRMCNYPSFYRGKLVTNRSKNQQLCIPYWLLDIIQQVIYNYYKYEQQNYIFIGFKLGINMF